MIMFTTRFSLDLELMLGLFTYYKCVEISEKFVGELYDLSEYKLILMFVIFPALHDYFMYTKLAS
jgi:hypothetical protein